MGIKEFMKLIHSEELFAKLVDISKGKFDDQNTYFKLDL